MPRKKSYCKSTLQKRKAARLRREQERRDRMYYPRSVREIEHNCDRVLTPKQLYVCEYLFENHCVDCGEKNIVVLDFDHIDEKNESIAKLVGSGTMEELLEEIPRCEVRCANCHREKTFGDGRSYKSFWVESDYYGSPRIQAIVKERRRRKAERADMLSKMAYCENPS